MNFTIAHWADLDLVIGENGQRDNAVVATTLSVNGWGLLQLDGLGWYQR